MDDGGDNGEEPRRPVGEAAMRGDRRRRWRQLRDRTVERRDGTPGGRHALAVTTNDASPRHNARAMSINTSPEALLTVAETGTVCRTATVRGSASFRDCDVLQLEISSRSVAETVGWAVNNMVIWANQIFIRRSKSNSYYAPQQNRCVFSNRRNDITQVDK